MDNSFKKYLGALIVILAAIVLICSYFFHWNNYNWVQVGALAVMICGILIHIFLNKKG